VVKWVVDKLVWLKEWPDRWVADKRHFGIFYRDWQDTLDNGLREDKWE